MDFYVYNYRILYLLTESEVEKQFADLRDVHNSDEFVRYLDSVITNKFTDDYFEYSLS